MQWGGIADCGLGKKGFIKKSTHGYKTKQANLSKFLPTIKYKKLLLPKMSSNTGLFMPWPRAGTEGESLTHFGQMAVGWLNGFFWFGHACSAFAMLIFCYPRGLPLSLIT